MNCLRRLRNYLLPAALLMFGCGPELSGRPVSGVVTFQGKPLENGSIQFYPAEGQPTFSGGNIENGQYRLPAEFGLAPGKYTVRINSPEGNAAADSLEMVDVKERIPAKYNTESTLSADVKESGENRFDFQIP
jgi:hypothetical protein